MIVAATIPAATSCTDYDDYNEAYSDVNAGADKSLWDNIVANPELSEFAALVKKAGFDADLASSKTYTVFAPLNDALDETAYADMDQETLLTRFVETHVANYNHAASGEVDNRIHTLNKKSYAFAGNGSYTYGGIDVKTANIPSTNGVLHTLGGVVEYRENVYDYILQNTQATKLSEYFKYYETKELDKENSVIGPIVDGKQTYLDSVMVINNLLLDRFNCSIDNEDSTYTMLIPTDEAWDEQYAKIKSCFNYIKNTPSQDIENTTATKDEDIPGTVMDDIDNTFWTDSLSKMMLVKDLIFSNNDYYNRWLTDSKHTFNDSLRSTIREKYSNPDAILAETIEEVPLSNGVGRVVDSIAVYPWESYVWEMTYGTDPRYYYSRALNGTQIYLSEEVDPQYGVLEGGQHLEYMLLQSPMKYSQPTIDVCLPSVMSSKYNFYVVVVTPKVDNYQSVNGYESDLPNSLHFTLNYSDKNGKLQNYKFSSDGKENPATAKPFVSDNSKIDTMFIGSFTFPVCYYGLITKDDKRVMPVLKIKSSFSQFSESSKAQYTMDMRIASVILRPAEMDEVQPLIRPKE